VLLLLLYSDNLSAVQIVESPIAPPVSSNDLVSCSQPTVETVRSLAGNDSRSAGCIDNVFFDFVIIIIVVVVERHN
jgi:hypothetical protein